MRLVIAAVGRAGDGPERLLFESYARRLPWPLELKEVAARGKPAGAARTAREAELLLKAVPGGAVVVALDEGGRTLGSREFARAIGRWRDDGRSHIAFLLGGADGHGAEALGRADLVLSLGPMTWPHLLVRAMLAEQLYRAASILEGHPYHRD